MRTGRADQETIREAVGIFFEVEQLEAAVDDLRSSGFDARSLGLLTSEDAVRRKLGAVYRKVPRHEQDSKDPAAPHLEFVARESMGDVAYAWLGGLFFVGTTTAAGLAVASAAVLGGALLAGVAGAAAVGAVGGALGMIIHQSDAEYLREQIDEGHLLLFVRTRDADQERLAVDILARHSGYDARIHTIRPGTRHFLDSGGAARGLVERALLDPTMVFATPEDVYRHDLLTTAQKIAILERWSADETELATATGESMLPAALEENDLFGRIRWLLGKLYAARTTRAPPDIGR